MDTAKLRVKIGLHEFEAEGPSEQVSQQFEDWKTLISDLAATQAPLKPIHNNITVTPASLALTSQNPVLSVIDQAQLGSIYTIDEKRDLILLRVLPTGEDRHRAAVLLIIYGYLRQAQMDEVPVTKLMASLVSSGSAPDRVDRAATPSVNDGLLVKSGSGKGGKYRLTNKGITRTEEMVAGLLQQLT